MSNKCPHYLYKSEVLATMTMQKIPFNEAADIVQDRFHEEGKPYSFAVRRNPQPTRNNRTQEEQPRRPSFEEILSPTPQNTKPIKEQTQNQQDIPSHNRKTLISIPQMTTPLEHNTKIQTNSLKIGQKQSAKLKCRNLPT